MSAVAGSQGLNVSNGDGASGNPTVGLSITGLSTGTFTGVSVLAFNDGTNNVKDTFTSLISTLGILLNAYSTVHANNGSDRVASGAATLNLIGSAGTGISTSRATGTITFRMDIGGLTDSDAPTGGNWIVYYTGASHLKRTFTEILTDFNIVNGISSNGIAVRIGANSYTNRSIVTGTGTTVTNGDGVSGNISVNLDINGLSAKATPAVGDYFAIYDTAGTAVKKTLLRGVQTLIQTGLTGTIIATVTRQGVGGTTQTIGTLPDTCRVLRVRRVVKTIWDVAQTVDIGISGGSTSALQANSENDPTILAAYVNDPDYRNSSGSGQTVIATVRTRGATQGSMQVIIEYIVSASA